MEKLKKEDVVKKAKSKADKQAKKVKDKADKQAKKVKDKADKQIKQVKFTTRAVKEVRGNFSFHQLYTK